MVVFIILASVSLLMSGVNSSQTCLSQFFSVFSVFSITGIVLSSVLQIVIVV